jgi:hypothetical protein
MVQKIESFILLRRDRLDEGRLSVNRKSLRTADLEYCLRMNFLKKLTFFFRLE